MGTLIVSFLNRLVTNPDTQTSALGITAGAIIAANVDYGKVIANDHGEQGKLLGAVVVGLFGYLTNKPKPKANSPAATGEPPATK
jgi:hypothetical protein